MPSPIVETGDAGVANDPMGAVNLITPQKRAAAAALVKTGRTVSLSRVFEPDQHFIRVNQRGTGGSVVDYYGFLYHGVTVTHVDASCHVWDRNGMWNGRDPAKEIDTNGTRFADITAFSGGLITRGVLLDVPRHRRTSYVSMERPVDGAELEAIAKAQGVVIEAGDALMVLQRTGSIRSVGSRLWPLDGARPGLDVSCARFIRDRDVAVLGWDMHDAMPDKDGLPWPVHGVSTVTGWRCWTTRCSSPWRRRVRRTAATSSCSWRCRSRLLVEQEAQSIRLRCSSDRRVAAQHVCTLGLHRSPTEGLIGSRNYGEELRMIGVIFEVWPAERRQQEYLDIAAALRPLLDQIDGFISIERFESLSEPGKILSLSFFRDEEAVAKWRALDQHRNAQARGRAGIFGTIALRIAGVIRDYGMFNREQVPADSKEFHPSGVRERSALSNGAA